MADFQGLLREIDPELSEALRKGELGPEGMRKLVSGSSALLWRERFENGLYPCREEMAFLAAVEEGHAHGRLRVHAFLLVDQNERSLQVEVLFDLETVALRLWHEASAACDAYREAELGDSLAMERALQSQAFAAHWRSLVSALIVFRLDAMKDEVLTPQQLSNLSAQIDNFASSTDLNLQPRNAKGAKG